jgi:NADPH:quinone reductase-like Zn-dependent oxidoreductase
LFIRRIWFVYKESLRCSTKIGAREWRVSMEERMRAAFYERQGKAQEVLQVGTLPDPQPGPGQVRVKVAVSGLNPSDIKTRTGFGGKSMGYPRIVPHQDGAGVIDRLGPGVPASRLGERVWVYHAQLGSAFGTAAEYVVVHLAQAVKLADAVSFETGACLGVAGMTAHRCLFADGGPRKRRVLVHGGAGAVGSAAIQLAKWTGAWVAATVGNEAQAEVAVRAGADLVIDRHREAVAERVNAASGGEGVSRIVDVGLDINIAVNLACMAPGGVVAAYSVGDPQTALAIPGLAALLKGVVLRFVYVYTMPEAAIVEASEDLSRCLADGAYQPRIGLQVPLARIADAHEAQEARTAIGKILVDLRA